MPVIFHRLADAEFQAARRAYARQNPAAGRRFVTEVRVAAARIDAQPAVGPLVFGAFRWVRVGRFRYLLYYRRLSPSLIQIYAVAHASRRPGYWLRRTTRP